jgi:hypothetical protein
MPELAAIVVASLAQSGEQPRDRSRDIMRSRRKRAVRATTVSTRLMPKYVLREGRLLHPPLGPEDGLPTRPTTRGQCEVCAACQEWRDAERSEAGGADLPLQGAVVLRCGHDTREALRRSRPCVFVSCTRNLYLDVSPQTGAIKLNLPDLEPEQMPARASCMLDVADLDGQTLEQVGDVLNVTRERVRQVEVKALAKMKAAGVDLRDWYGERDGDGRKRRLPVLQDDEETGDETREP